MDAPERRVERSEADPVERYLRESARDRRRRARPAAAVLVVAGIATGALATRMTDIGHFVGFAAAALLLVAGGAIVAIAVR